MTSTSLLRRRRQRLGTPARRRFVRTWPEPVVSPPPRPLQLAAVLAYGEPDETSDGCIVDPGSVCVHGHPSWLRRWEIL